MADVKNIYEWVRVWDIEPCPKPRMTRSDTWKKRPIVVNYRNFCDLCKLYNVIIPKMSTHVVFVMPMPLSWSKSKRLRMNGQPHKSRKDVDNMIKALLDATYADDKEVWDIRGTKVWGEKGQIIIGKTLDNPLQMYHNMLDYFINNNEA